MLFGSNFIELLCESESLDEISHICSAQQSSLSKWSRENDANGVLSDCDREFANHTDFEFSPWLTIDLKQQRYPEYIVVQNRARKPFDEIAATLKVEYSEDNQSFSLLHSGKVFFESLPGGLPLILPLKSKIKFRYLKLSLNSDVKVPLHLKRVNILVRKRPVLTQDPNELVFYSSRTDGLGERLKSLLNAMVLSKYYEAGFRFTWTNPPNLGETHSVDDAGLTFSEAFLEKHLVEELPTQLLELDNKPVNFEQAFKNANAIKVTQNIFYRQIPSLKNHIPRSAFCEAFNAIQFTQDVADSIEYAKSIKIPENSVSLHLRSGDIIYGRYRYDDRYTNKVISYVQADFMIKELQQSDTTVVIFGQNSEVCRYLANKHSNALYMGDNPNVMRLNSLQLSLFDMVLMSRTNVIFAGNSGFSQLAELIGNARIRNPATFFNANKMASHIESFLKSEETKNFDALQNAFSCWHYVFNFKNIISKNSSIDMLKKAVTFDPANLFYLIVLSVFYFDNSQMKESEAVIQDILSRKDDVSEKFGHYKFLQTYRHPDGSSPLRNFRDSLKLMSDAGLCGADTLFNDLV